MAAAILRLPDVKTRTGLSRSTIYFRVSQGLFPSPISLGAAQKLGGDQSRIDMRFAGILLSRVGNDIARADRIARSTEFYRKKWDEPRNETTWFGYTLAQAAGGVHTQTEVQELNGQYAVVSTGNRVNILQETVDPSSKEPTISLLGVSDFRLWLRNRRVDEKLNRPGFSGDSLC